MTQPTGSVASLIRHVRYGERPRRPGLYLGLFHGRDRPDARMDDWGYNNNPGHIYEAMAIKNQRIQALNTTEYIKTLANADTKVYDAKGQTVSGSDFRYRKPLLPNEVVAVELRSPSKPGMANSQYKFEQANGTVKPKRVAKLDVPKDAAKK